MAANISKRVRLYWWACHCLSLVLSPLHMCLPNVFRFISFFSFEKNGAGNHLNVRFCIDAIFNFEMDRITLLSESARPVWIYKSIFYECKKLLNFIHFCSKIHLALWKCIYFYWDNLMNRFSFKYFFNFFSSKWVYEHVANTKKYQNESL